MAGNEGRMSASEIGTVAVACDHAGLPIKDEGLQSLRELGVAHEDMGVTDATTSVDYPDYAHRVASSVADGKHRIGVLVCGSGVGMSITANKPRGIRAVVGSEPSSAAMARRHNDANVLCMGARVVGPGLAETILEAFLGGAFEGGRHERRVSKIEPA